MGGYLTTDSEFLKRDVRGGTCSVTALITGGNLVVSNAGDCRAVSSKRGVAEALTSDHRPSREDERERIEMLVSNRISCISASLILFLLFCPYSLVYLAADLRLMCGVCSQGGFVECRNGVWRVLGSLAISRAIGDQYLKQWVTAEPETKIVKLDREYEFLLLASDGLWDKVIKMHFILFWGKIICRYTSCFGANS